MKNTDKKKYFAFISYSHKDSEMAKWLEHELEYYELPARLFEKRKDLRKEDFTEPIFRPVFRDEDELSGGELEPQIIEALSDSEYLIVVCSPNAVASKYVDSEIQEFIKQSEENKKKIFPFIIEGEPHQDGNNKDKECFPETLRKLSEDKTASVELIAGDINVHETGKGHAFVKIIAGMLREKTIKFADLWDRYEYEKAKNERIEREKKEKLQIAQSRFVAEKARSVAEDNSYLAKRLAIEILPSDLKSPNRPYVSEAEAFLRYAWKYDTAVLKDGNMARSVTITHDGKYFASANGNKIIIWDAESGNQLRVLNGHTSLVLTVAYSANGKRIASASADDTIMIWDAESGNMIAKLKVSYLISAALDSDGVFVVSTSYDGTVRIWNVETGEEKKVLKNYEDAGNLWNSSRAVRSVIFSPDGKTIVVSSSDSTICIWSIESGMKLITLKGHESEVNCAVYSPNGERIASASSDNTVRIWDSKSGKELSILKGHTDIVNTVAFSIDGQYLVSASHDNTVRIWDTISGAEIKKLEGHVARVYSAVFTPDGKHIVSASRDCTIRIWEFENIVVPKVLKGHVACVNHCVFSPNGGQIASVSCDETCRIWDVKSASELRVLDGHTSYVEAIVFSPDGKRVASASQDKTIRIWDTGSGKELNVLKGHTSFVYSVEYSPDGKQIVSSSADDTIRIWDTESETTLTVIDAKSRCIKENKEDDYRVFSVFYAAFSPDGKRLISVAGDETVKIWNLDSGVMINSVSIREVYAAAFNHNGKQFVSVSVDNIVRFWDVESGKEVRIGEAQLLGIRSSLFSPDGKYLVSANQDNTVVVIEIDSGVEIITYKGHTEEIRSVAFDSDGRHIASASLDKTIRIWDFPPLEDLIKLTHDRFDGNPLTPEERKQYYLE